VKNFRGAIEKARTSATLGLEQFPNGGRAEWNLLLLERQTDVVDRMVLLAQGDDQRTGGILLGLGAWTGAGGSKVGGIRLAHEGVAKDTESAGRVAEGSGDLVRGATLDVEGAESFVLALLRMLGLEEEGARVC
jgi:hypothetical protein